jgi:hypothetical protein
VRHTEQGEGEERSPDGHEQSLACSLQRGQPLLRRLHHLRVALARDEQLWIPGSCAAVALQLDRADLGDGIQQRLAQ